MIAGEYCVDDYSKAEVLFNIDPLERSRDWWLIVVNEHEDWSVNKIKSKYFI